MFIFKTITKLLMGQWGRENEIMLTHKQKYDYHDIDPWELKLIRVGHALWTLLRAERRSLGQPLCEELALKRGLETARTPPESAETRALDDAIQIIVRLKREKRAELKSERAIRAEEVRERFRSVA
jgi:hypothetical protein